MQPHTQTIWQSQIYATTHTDIDRDVGHNLDPQFDLDPKFDHDPNFDLYPEFDLDPEFSLTQNFTLTQNSTLTQIDFADQGFIIKTWFLWAFLVITLCKNGNSHRLHAAV